MFFFSRLRKWNTKRCAKRPTPGRLKHARFRPAFESLEDRSVPALLNVTTALDVLDANDGLLSLREAVIQANTANDADTINLPAGTYTLTGSADDDEAFTGDLDLAERVTIRGAGADASIIDAAGRDRVFTVHGTQVTLSDMTIQGGHTPQGGGGILVRPNSDSHQWTTLTVIDSTISNNYSGFFGGGIDVEGGRTHVMIRNSTLSNNISDYSGGGIFGYQATITIQSSTFTGNSSSAEGGALTGYYGTWVIDHASLAGNSALIGGGISAFYGEWIISNTYFANNVALTGGALRVVNSDVKMSVIHCTFTGNIAIESDFFPGAFGTGGAIYNEGPDTRVIHCTFTGNSAEQAGGGIYNAGTLIIHNSTFLGNSAPLGGDLYNAGVLYLFGPVPDDAVLGTLLNLEQPPQAVWSLGEEKLPSVAQVSL